jgi:RNase P/RNase MRP subunit POP5
VVCRYFVVPQGVFVRSSRHPTLSRSTSPLILRTRGLPPTRKLRLKVRFYVAELEQAAPPACTSAADVRAALGAALAEAFGETAAGLAEASRVLAVRYYSRRAGADAGATAATAAAAAAGGAFVVRAPAAVDRQLRAALALLRSVRGRPAAARLRRVCGSVRTLRQAAAALGLAGAPDAFGTQPDALAAAITAASAASEAAAAARGRPSVAVAR